MGSQHRGGAYSPVRSSHQVPAEWPSTRVLDGTGHYLAWIALLLSTIDHGRDSANTTEQKLRL